jgi:hypothetical protein
MGVELSIISSSIMNVAVTLECLECVHISYTPQHSIIVIQYVKRQVDNSSSAYYQTLSHNA